MVSIKNKLQLIFSIILCHLAGIIGTFFTTNAIDSWYQYLNKPSFTPPNYLFAPVWLTLYTLMGIALYLITINKKDFKIRHTTLIFFIIQLILNASWSIIFFGLQSLLGGLINIILLWIFIAITIAWAYRINKTVSYLLIPYILWVSLAGLLNLYILLLN